MFPPLSATAVKLPLSKALNLPSKSSWELLRWPPRVNKGFLKRERSLLCASCEEIKVMKTEIRDRGMCVCGSVRKPCVDRRSVPPVRPLEKSQVTAGGRRGAGQRLCCSVNTSHGEGAHEVKRHISGSDFLGCGDKIRLRSDCRSLGFNLRHFQIQEPGEHVLCIRGEA